MTIHNTLAFALAEEAIRQIRQGGAPWDVVFSANVYTGASRQWPLPDFIIFDADTKNSMAGEFKPPDQTKREYLTGLGQAIAYTRDFSYGMLVVPAVADDDNPIARHIQEVLDQDEMANVPVG